MRDIGVEYPELGQMRLFSIGEPPELEAKEVLLETRFSGVTNGTERHAILDEFGLGRWPGRHGYQQVGRVVNLGRDVAELEEGNWVFYGGYVGHRAWNVVNTASPEMLCVKLPQDGDLQSFALLGVAGVAMRAVRRTRVGPSLRVWVVGCGLIGQYSAQCARALGAHVTVSDINPERLEIARELGAHEVVDANNAGGYEELQAGGPYDRIIDASGYPPLLHDIYNHRLLAKGGVIGLIAVRGETSFPWGLLHTRESSIEVSCHFSRDDLKALVHLISTGVIRTQPLIKTESSIDDAPGVYEILRDRPGELLGIVFDWRE